MDKYINNYNTLGIQPGASWKELRAAYKNLVKTWHPDRFQQDAHQKKIAEERTKEINKSYKELAEYYKKHGALPIDNETLRASHDAAAPDKPESSRKSASPPTNTASPIHAAPPVKEKSPRISRMAMVLGVAGAVYILWDLTATQPPGEAPQREETRLQCEDPTEEMRKAKESQKTSHDKDEDNGNVKFDECVDHIFILPNEE